MKIRLERKNNAFHFEVKNELGLTINTDGSAQIGGENKGFRPMELMLSGVASCSTIDLLLILKKQRQAVTDVKIEVTAERTENKSKMFKNIHLTYFISGNIAPSKMEKAIALSVKKYCSAIQSLNSEILITTSYKIN